MCDVKGYAELIKRGNPDFIELKSYVWVGESQNFYKVENMPYMEDLENFMKELLKEIPEYEYTKEHIPSRAILLIKKSLKKKCWINFPRFFDLIESGKKFKAKDYCSKVIQPNDFARVI